MPSDFNIHRKVESKPKAINIPCLKKFEVTICSHDSCKSLSEELSNYLLAIIQVRKGRFL